jgi:hypothetical protein
MRRANHLQSAIVRHGFKSFTRHGRSPLPIRMHGKCCNLWKDGGVSRYFHRNVHCGVQILQQQATRPAKSRLWPR